MTDPKEVLAMQRCCGAKCNATGKLGDACMARLYDEAATGYIAALRAAGYQIAPIEPTNVQTDHGMRAFDLRIDPRRAVKAMYRAMLAAAGADCQGCRLGWPLRRDTETGEMCHWADPRTNVGPCAAAGARDGE